MEERNKFVIRDSEAGNEIEEAKTLEEAIEIIKSYEKSDKKEGIYVENFYEIYDVENDQIIEY